jgi:hypothetical protein
VNLNVPEGWSVPPAPRRRGEGEALKEQEVEMDWADKELLAIKDAEIGYLERALAKSRDHVAALTKAATIGQRGLDDLRARLADANKLAEERKGLLEKLQEAQHQDGHVICPRCYDLGYSNGRDGEARVAGQNSNPSFVAGRDVGYTEGYKTALKHLRTHCEDEERNLDV